MYIYKSETSPPAVPVHTKITAAVVYSSAVRGKRVAVRGVVIVLNRVFYRQDA